MIKKKRLTAKEAIKANIVVSTCFGKILRTSLGPMGMDKIVQDRDGEITVTNDGATILDKLSVDNHIGKLFVELSKSQDYEIGDGTTGVVVIAASLLEISEVLIDKGIHPLRISEGYQMACLIAINNLNKIACKFKLGNADSEKLVNTCITTLSSKIVNRHKRQLAELCVKAVMAVADIEKNDINIELIKVDGKVGGKLEDTAFIDGLVIQKEMSHPLMKKQIENARIALLTCPFEPPKPKTKHKVEIKTATHFETLRKMECAYFTNMVNQCKHSGADIVICQWGFDDEPNHLLMHHGLQAVRWVGGVEIELIAVATGARIVPRFQEICSEKLGFAKMIREVGFGTSKDKVIFLEGCPQSRAVTLMVRAGSKTVVDETKRSIHDAICVARNLIRANGILYGGGSAEIACSLAVTNCTTNIRGVEQYAMSAFADALEQIPLALAENAGFNSLQTLINLKIRQAKEKNPYLGVDCSEKGTNDMREQNVFETLIGKRQQLLLATQLCKTILKIDDVILLNEDR
jgi:T-complex protein 1 subunit epsilon